MLGLLAAAGRLRRCRRYRHLLAAALVKAVLWVVFLPFRLVFWLFLPLLLVVEAGRPVSGRLDHRPGHSAGVIVALIAAVAAVAVPLLPILFIGFVIWLLVRSSRPAVAYESDALRGGGLSRANVVARSNASATRSTVASSMARPVSWRLHGSRSFGEAARNRDRRQAREVGRHGEDVGQVHLQRIVHALAERECRRGARRHRDQVDALQRRS